MWAKAFQKEKIAISQVLGPYKNFSILKIQQQGTK